MTIQDYMVQQMPHKAKAEMAFNKGDYAAAAENIINFANGCGNADKQFDPNKDPKVDQVCMIGYNNAALMLCKILDQTGLTIGHPVNDNPYATKTVGSDDNVPENVATYTFAICYVAASYADIIYDTEPSPTHAMGLLTSLNQLCIAGFYYNQFDEEDMAYTLRMIDKADGLAGKLKERFPNEDQVSNIVKTFYTTAGMFYEHYANVCGDMDKFLDYKLKGNEMQLKSFRM